MIWHKATIILTVVGLVDAHMLLQYPAPLRAPFNPFTGSDGDYDLTTPLSSDGSNFPCRGALKALGTDEAKPVASWTAGEKYNLTISGGAPHGGGSCQASISSDQGKSFTVIHTWTGGCPGLDGPNSSFDFQLPSDTRNGEVIFAWTWFNKLGNREMYMNCASVEITGSSSGSKTVAFKDRPAMFVANVNGCKTVDSKDVKIPNPGPDVTQNSSDEAPPTGDCDKEAPGSGSGAEPAAQSSTAGGAVPTSVPSGSDEGNNGSGATDPTPTADGAFVTASPSTGSNPSSSAEDPNQTGSNSGDSGFVPGNDWPAGFSGAEKTHVHLVGLALISLFVLDVIT